MHTLVIYDSLFGNTEKLAHSIASGIGKNVPVMKVNEVNPESLQNLDLLVIGSPTHGGWPSEKTKSFINSLSEGVLHELRTATFDTSISVEGQSKVTKFFVKMFGYAAGRLTAMSKKKGASIVASESFYVSGKEGPLVEGEISRAKKWAASIANGRSAASSTQTSRGVSTSPKATSDMAEGVAGTIFTILFLLLVNRFYKDVQFLTSDFEVILPLYNLSLVTSSIAYLTRIFFHSPVYKQATDWFSCIFFVLIALQLWTIFPFDTSVIGDKVLWDGVFRFLIVVPPLLTVLANMVKTAKLASQA